jgi:protein disulfide-isomerase
MPSRYQRIERLIVKQVISVRLVTLLEAMTTMQAIGWLPCLGTLVLVVSAASANAQPAGVIWHHDLEAARQVAAQTNRPLLVHFWATWCEPCMRMDRDVFSQRDVASMIQREFIPVRLNADHFLASARQYDVTALPTDVILAADGRVLGKYPCPATAPAYLAALQAAAAGRAPGSSIAAQPASSPMPGSMAAADPRSAMPSTPPGFPPQAYPASSIPFANANSTPSRPVTAASAGAVGVTPPPVRENLARRFQANPPGGTVSSSSGMVPPVPPSVPSFEPPLGLDGFCPVTLNDKKDWVRGDKRWGAIHRGRTYLFASREAFTRFWEHPDQYSPVLAGLDPVMAIDQGQSMSGHRRHGVFYGGRVYLFASETSLQHFSKNPARYADGVRQAMQTAPGQPVKR